jgi:hypothetical protein
LRSSAPFCSARFEFEYSHADRICTDVSDTGERRLSGVCILRLDTELH